MNFKIDFSTMFLLIFILFLIDGSKGLDLLDVTINYVESLSECTPNEQFNRD